MLVKIGYYLNNSTQNTYSIKSLIKIVYRINKISRTNDLLATMAAAILNECESNCIHYIDAFKLFLFKDDKG